MKKILFLILIFSSILFSGCIDKEYIHENIGYPSNEYLKEDMEKILLSDEYINGTEITYLKIDKHGDYIEINHNEMHCDLIKLLYYPIPQNEQPRFHVTKKIILQQDDDILIGKSNIIQRTEYTYVIFADSNTIYELELYYALLPRSNLTYQGNHT